jgi:hypothetical protein
MDNKDGNILTGELVEKSGDAWIYSNVQYWLKKHQYHFFALTPYVAGEANNAVVTLSADPYTDYLGGLAYTNVDGTEDLLYAATTVSTHDIELGEAPVEKVKFQFSHLLSKVKFSFTNGFDNNNAYIDVKNVKMEVPAFASINLAQADWWSTNQWVLVEGQTSTLSFGDACAKTAPNVKQETDNERLTIPAGANQTYKITFDVALYFGDVKAFEKVNDIKIPYVIAPRRPGDVDECYADSSKAAKMLGWTAEKTLEDMCADTWNWQKNNPNGYAE